MASPAALTSSGNRSCSRYRGACSESPNVVKPWRTASRTTSSSASLACRQNWPEWEWCECILPLRERSERNVSFSGWQV